MLLQSLLADRARQKHNEQYGYHCIIKEVYQKSGERNLHLKQRVKESTTGSPHKAQ